MAPRAPDSFCWFCSASKSRRFFRFSNSKLQSSTFQFYLDTIFFQFVTPRSKESCYRAGSLCYSCVQKISSFEEFQSASIGHLKENVRNYDCLSLDSEGSIDRRSTDCLSLDPEGSIDRRSTDGLSLEPNQDLICRRSTDHDYCKKHGESMENTFGQLVPDHSYTTKAKEEEESFPFKLQNPLHTLEHHDILKEIDCEVTGLCTKANPSILRSCKSAGFLAEKKMTTQIFSEICTRCPTLLDVLLAVTCGAGRVPNHEKLVAPLVAVYSILMFTRCQPLSALQRMVSFVGLRGHMEDSVRRHLNDDVVYGPRCSYQPKTTGTWSQADTNIEG